MAAEEKDRLCRYRIRRSIGKGSYGEVFLVTHKGDGKQVGWPAHLMPQASWRFLRST